MSEAAAPGRLPSWADQMRALEGVGDQPHRHLASGRRQRGRGAGHEQARALDPVLRLPVPGLHRRAAGRCSCRSGTTRSTRAAPTPTTSTRPPRSTPRASTGSPGYRGTIALRRDHPAELRHDEPERRRAGRTGRAATHDLDDLTHRRRRLLQRRPERAAARRATTGDWWQLDPRTKRLLMRKCSCDWSNEVDARVAINRLDDGGADMTPEEIARRFSDLSAWIEGMIEFDMQLVRYYREHHGVNTFLRSSKIDSHGRAADAGLLRRHPRDRRRPRR